MCCYLRVPSGLEVSEGGCGPDVTVASQVWCTCVVGTRGAYETSRGPQLRQLGSQMLGQVLGILIEPVWSSEADTVGLVHPSLYFTSSSSAPPLLVGRVGGVGVGVSDGTLGLFDDIGSYLGSVMVPWDAFDIFMEACLVRQAGHPHTLSLIHF